ncbi:toxin-antitoxin system YwqK family antitoxin [Aquimarina sp. RZ0]|uniref:toxin-antitoxin system YwqK family antitoxin n=1 Tax=Aquimarina sp. RZ0 TaxID=2607730 RepID=UPI0011F2DD92|nr:hypothetical protein [Aquimarina sp. RZ0]KAA1243270.1 hypothetical protein F0000_21695 [Aquimarina sp. RZ0]
MKIIFLITCLSISIFLNAQKILKPAVKIPISKIESTIKNGNYSFSSKITEKELQGSYEVFLDKVSFSDTPILLDSKYIVDKGSFHKGYKTGLLKTTYKGKLVKTENWNNGLILGKYKVYDTDGNILYQTSFGSKGISKYKDYYYKTGVLKEEGTYENGKKQGEWCDYDKKGMLKKTIKYIDGEEVSK